MPVTVFALGLALVALLSSGVGADTLSVADIGSFHVGGRAVSLTGLPTRDVVIQKWMADRGLMK